MTATAPTLSELSIGPNRLGGAVTWPLHLLKTGEWKLFHTPGSKHVCASFLRRKGGNPNSLVPAVFEAMKPHITLISKDALGEVYTAREGL